VDTARGGSRLRGGEERGGIKWVMAEDIDQRCRHAMHLTVNVPSISCQAPLGPHISSTRPHRLSPPSQ